MCPQDTSSPGPLPDTVNISLTCCGLHCSGPLLLSPCLNSLPLYHLVQFEASTKSRSGVIPSLEPSPLFLGRTNYSILHPLIEVIAQRSPSQNDLSYPLSLRWSLPDPVPESDSVTSHCFTFFPEPLPPGSLVGALLTTPNIGSWEKEPHVFTAAPPGPMQACT